MKFTATLCLAAAVSAVTIRDAFATAPVHTATTPVAAKVHTATAPVAAKVHTPVPCLRVPSTYDAWTIFNHLDGNHDMVIDITELEGAAKALDDLHEKSKANFDSTLITDIKKKVKSFLADHNGAIPMSAGVLGLQKGIAMLNAHTNACANNAEPVDAAQAAIRHFKMLDPLPCVSVPEHGDAQTVFNHIDGIENKDGQVTSAEMEKAMQEVWKFVHSHGNFNPKYIEGTKDAIKQFMDEHKGSVNEQEGIEGLQNGMRILNRATKSCQAVGELNGVESVNLAAMAINHWNMDAQREAPATKAI